MRPPAQIREWLGIGEMFKWLQEAANEASYTRRMAIWLTHTGNLHAHKVAEILGVSTQAVWLWISQYNRSGPEGLVRRGRGGRRWGLMTHQEEEQLLTPLIQKVRSGSPPKPKAIRQIIEKKLGGPVSMSYVYRLLRRHNWADVLARSHTTGSAASNPETFAQLSHPWRRAD